MRVSKPEMDAALKTIVVPGLRSAGFKGSYPHFYRDRGHVDLLDFQFSLSGGRFVSEIAFATPTRDNIPERFRDVPASKLRGFFTGQRLRLGSHDRKEHWFIYDQPLTSHGEMASSPTELAMEVADLVRSQGEEWWSQWRVST